MKKTIFTLAIAAVAMLVSSCGGNKTETQSADQPVASEQTVDDAASKVTRAQINALVDAKLITEADLAKPVFIDFNATWCGPCRAFGPYFEAAAQKYADKASFVAVDVDVYGEVANAFGVESIPMVVAILPSGETVTYIGTQDIVGDGVFDAIVENLTK